MRTRTTTKISASMLALLLLPQQVGAQAVDARRTTAAAAPDLAFADRDDPNPGTGTAKLIAGWASLGVAALNVAQVPLCYVLGSSWSSTRCVLTSATFAGVGLGLGLPLVVYGHRQRARQRAWLKRHGLSALEQLRWEAQRAGGGITYRHAF